MLSPLFPLFNTVFFLGFILDQEAYIPPSLYPEPSLLISPFHFSGIILVEDELVSLAPSLCPPPSHGKATLAEGKTAFELCPLQDA